MFIISLIVFSLLSYSNIENNYSTPFPIDLTCEYLKQPIGIDKESPRLSWNIQTFSRNWKQGAYEIIVASEKEKLNKNIGDLWESGKVESGNNINVTYNGLKLTSLMNCWWKVRVWDKDGNVSNWSSPAFWKMGILYREGWKGNWITSDLRLYDYQKRLRDYPDFNMEPETSIWETADSIRKHINIPKKAPAVYFRKYFKLKKEIKRGTLFISGLGFSEIYINGDKIGNKEYFNPAYTDYEKRVLYNTFDVTTNLKKENVIGVILGNGWYNPIVPHVLRYYAANYISTPKLLMNLYIEYKDGSKEFIVSDSSWKFNTEGPIIFNDILGGETYDARKEFNGWNQLYFNAENWKRAKIAQPPKGKLKYQQLNPVKALDSLSAIKVEKCKGGYRFDLGRPISGWAKIKLKGAENQKVRIYYPGADSHTLGRYQTDYFIFGNREVEVYESKFSYKGFRYVIVEGLDYEPSVSDLIGVSIGTNLKKTGSFKCSNDTLNEINEILLNTIHNFVMHLPKDPTREKSAWVQDIESGFDVNAYNFDVVNMYRKWQFDFLDIIHDNGYVPPVVPGRFDGLTINGPWWGGMIIFNAIKLYNYYKDLDIIINSYDSMKLYLSFLTSISKGNIIEWGLGEWMEPFRENESARPTTTPVSLTSTAAYYFYSCWMEKFAILLKKDKDALYFNELSAKIKSSYNKTFLKSGSGQYALGSQAGQLMSLHFDLVPPSEKARAIKKLKEYICEREGHLSTGFVATPLLLTTLSDLGLKEKAYKMATKKDFPGWYNMIYSGKDSIMKENWEGGLVQMPSLAGPIGYWFFYSLAGIKPLSPGFQKIEISPDFVEDLRWVDASYRSVFGQIVSKWRRTPKGLIVHLKIPANTTALVKLPVSNIENVWEGDKKIRKIKELEIKRIKNGKIILKIGSGNYRFRINNL